MWSTIWVGMKLRMTGSQLDSFIAPFLEDLEILFSLVLCEGLGL